MKNLWDTVKTYKWPSDTSKVLKITNHQEIQNKTTTGYHFTPILGWLL